MYFSILFSQAKSYLSIKGVFFICIVSSPNCANEALMIHSAFRMWFLSFDRSSIYHSVSRAIMRLTLSLATPLFFMTHWMISLRTYLFFCCFKTNSVYIKFCSTKKLLTNSFRPSILSFYILTILSWSLISCSNEYTCAYLFSCF